MEMRTPAIKTAHPILYLVLYMPFGAVGGYLSVTLAYQLKHVGVSTEAIAGLVALAVLPNVLKVLWAPLVDTLLSPKLWYLLGVVVSGLIVAGIGAMPLGPTSVVWLAPATVVINTVVTVTAMGGEVLMAHGTTPHEKGRAGGWSQAGNLGGGGLGGGLGLWLATNVSPLAAGLVLGAAIIACALPLLFLPNASVEHRDANYIKSLASVAKDVWSIARSRAGLLALFVFVMPLGTNIAGSLMPAIADDWRVSANTVSLVLGVVAGVAAIPGALAGGYISDLINRRGAYVLFGLLQGACVLGMAIAPRTPLMFVIFALAYQVVGGMAFGAYAAVALEAIGGGAAATKFNLLASFANAPLLYCALIEGWVSTRFGSGAMLASEAVLAVVGAALFLGFAAAIRPRAPAAAI